MDKAQSFIIIEEFIADIIQQVCELQWEKEVLQGMTQYIIDHTLLYAPKMLLVTPDSKQDDIYFQTADADEIEPISSMLDSYAQEKAPKKVRPLEEKDETLDLTTPLKEDSPRSQKRQSFTRRSVMTIRRESSSKFSVTSLSVQKNNAKKKETDLFLLKNAPQQVQEWEDKGNIGKTAEEINEEMRLIETLRKKVMIDQQNKKMQQQGSRKRINVCNESLNEKLDITDDSILKQQKKLPNLFQNFTQYSLIENEGKQKTKVRMTQTKMQSTNNNEGIKDSYVQNISKKTLLLQGSSSKMENEEIRSSLSSKEHIIPTNGVTFIEHEKGIRKSNQDLSAQATNVKYGPRYGSQYQGTKMSLNQYKTMQGFKIFPNEKSNSNTIESQQTQTQSTLKQPVQSRNIQQQAKTVYTSFLKKRNQSRDKSVIISTIDDPSILYFPSAMNQSFQKDVLNKSTYEHLSRPLTRAQNATQIYNQPSSAILKSRNLKLKLRYTAQNESANKTAQSFLADINNKSIDTSYHNQKHTEIKAGTRMKSSNIMNRKRLT